MVCKIVLLGDMGGGKTSICVRYYNSTFCEQHDATIGGCFMTKDVRVGDATIRFEMWDTAGQERYRSLAQMYYK